MKRVVVSGWYGCGNVGDEAILGALLDGMIERYGDDVEVTVLSPQPANVTRSFGGMGRIEAIRHHSFLRRGGLIQLLARGELSVLLDRMRRADLFLLGGGGLIQDVIRVGNLFKYLDDCLLARRYAVPSMFFGIGVGPLVTRTGRGLTRFVAERVDLITVRDRAGETILREVGVQRTPVYSTADPALLLRRAESPAPATGSLLESIGDHPFTVAICPRPRVSWTRLTDEDWSRLLDELARTCDALIRRHDARIVFLPFMEDDIPVNQRIRDRMAERRGVLVVESPPGPRDTLLVLRRMRYVIGMRLHSLILGAAEHVPPIGIGYAPKVRSFFDEIENLGLYVGERELAAADLTAFIDAYEQDRAGRLDELSRVIRRRKRVARWNLECAFGLLENRRPQPADFEAYCTETPVGG
jgi:polysaccharide pyruvyl transferase CsaB